MVHFLDSTRILCYGNWSVVGNRGGRWTLWNRGDIGLSPASRETTQRKLEVINAFSKYIQIFKCGLVKKYSKINFMEFF